MSNSDDILGLSPLSPDPNFEPSSFSSGDGSNDSKSLSPISRGSVRQKIMMDVTADKSKYGMQHVSDMGQYAFSVFNETTRYIITLSDQSRGKSYEKYCVAFGERLIKLNARHIHGLLEVGAVRIAQEVHKPPEVDDEPNLWRTIFGR